MTTTPHKDAKVDHKVDPKQPEPKHDVKTEQKQDNSAEPVKDAAASSKASPDLVEVKHVSNPNAGLTWDGKPYEAGKDGKFKVPAAALGDIAAHGFYPC